MIDMTSVKFSRTLTWVGLGFGAGVMGLTVYLWVKPLHFEVTNPWTSPPRVHVCDTSPASVERVKRAMAFVEDNCGVFSEVVETGPCIFTDNGIPSGFNDSTYYGKAFIDLRGYGFNESHAGLTTVHFSESTGRMLWTLTQIPEDRVSDDSMVLEHELIHVLGIDRQRDHTSRNGHILNYTTIDGGWNTSGICDSLTPVYGAMR